MCNQGLGQFHIIARGHCHDCVHHVHVDVHRSCTFKTSPFNMGHGCSPRIQHSCPDAAKHQLVQSMPFSMVDLRSHKPNKHFPLFFDLGRRRAPGCNRIQEFCESVIIRVFTEAILTLNKSRDDGKYIYLASGGLLLPCGSEKLSQVTHSVHEHENTVPILSLHPPLLDRKLTNLSWAPYGHKQQSCGIKIA